MSTLTIQHYAKESRIHKVLIHYTGTCSSSSDANKWHMSYVYNFYTHGYMSQPPDGPPLTKAHATPQNSYTIHGFESDLRYANPVRKSFKRHDNARSMETWSRYPLSGTTANKTTTRANPTLQPPKIASRASRRDTRAPLPI